jgi:glycosyltransferase involved in cell wall biosynthesis
MFKQAAAVIAVSKVMEQKLIQLGCPQQKLHYITYGPNDNFFEITPLYNKKLFIAIGRFVDKKAPYYLIFSFIEVLKLHPEAKLVIGGDGPLLNTCKNLIRFYKFENRIELPGVLNPEKFRDYLISAKAFVQHSITAENGDMEGTPVAVLEASAAGLPVLSTNHAGIPDVIIHEKTGFLVSEHDVSGMAKYMCKVLENSQLSEQLGKAGRENIKQNYTMGIHLKKISDLVLNVSAIT